MLPSPSLDISELALAPSDTVESTLAVKPAPPLNPGPPEPPYSILSNRAKWGVVLLISTAGLFSPLTANIYFPTIPTIAADLHVSIEQVNLSVTWYMILQGVSPTVWGSICDVLGRRPVYLATFCIYIGASIGLANTHSYWLLVLLRCVQAAGSASVIAIGSGSIGDVAPPKERGGFMGIFSLGAMFGAAVGPVVGGLLSQAYHWQSLFWFLAAFAGTVLILMIAVLPETLRSLVGNGSIPARGFNRSLLSLFLSRRGPKQPLDPAVVAAFPPRKTWRDIEPLAPFRLFAEKDILLLLTFNSLIYTLFYCVITSTSNSFKATYDLSENALGLCFLANGGGCLVAALINGPLMNHDYRVVAAQVERAKAAAADLGVEGGEEDEKEKGTAKVTVTKDSNDLASFPIEHARLRSLPVFFVVYISVCIIYGWTVEKAVHLSVPLICQFFVGLCVTTQFNAIGTLLVDLHPTRSASATAANNLYRCLMGAAGTAVINPIIDALGTGWTFTMLSFITVAFVPLIIIEWKFGMRFRNERKQAERERKERKEAARGAGL